ncbi:hypothetical protein [Dyella sp.]|uniref:hypothetical protein n=1 Tax=Dyella sp. TaxID=1869338 RepID=UPI002B49CDEC|nr:hypothetical protein [Dyella sp.]HKT28135.1 hypothetical protein [Dyella sp.]
MSVPFDSGASGHLRAHPTMLFVVLVIVALATADLLFACSFWHALYRVPPVRILQNIAAGLLGKRAFLGGGGTVALGALLHYAIMSVMVGVYYLASRRVDGLFERPWLYGCLYGLGLFVVMNLIVVPLSAVPKTPVPASWVVSSIVVHVIIGLVIALSLRRAA